MTIRERLSAAEARSRASRSDATVWDAKILLAHAIGHARPLALDPRETLSGEAAERFGALWEKRLEGRPVQHLLGEWDFFGRPFRVDARALVPRPETELLIETALAEAPGARRVLDLGTGAGVLAITWLLERPGARAVAIDSSVEALALSRENAVRHGVVDRMDLVGGDWTNALSREGSTRFDLVLSNPPYLALADADGLSPTVRDHDPAAALFSGADGLDAIRSLLDGLPPHLAPGAPFVFEIGAGQADAVAREVGARPAWRLVRIDPDLAALPRVALLRRR